MKLKKDAFSLIELLVAITIASIVMTLALGTVGSVYFTQKRMEISQDFYAETRLLMEQIVQIVRNNTIDYDSYFVEVGPNLDSCDAFQQTQLPEEVESNNNTLEVRKQLDYESVFYWDTNGDGVQDRNLGGYNREGSAVDPCTQAFYGEQEVLYLINGSRNKRVKLRQDGQRIKISREAGVDEDGDLKVDFWTSSVEWDKDTMSCIDTGTGLKTFGEQSVELCENVYDETIISPMAIKIDNLKFSLAPDRDPFLSYRNDDVQVHPHVFISLEAELDNYKQYGMDETEAPRLSFQTTASSRVFGNPR